MKKYWASRWGIERWFGWWLSCLLLLVILSPALFLGGNNPATCSGAHSRAWSAPPRIFKRHWFKYWQLASVNLPPVIVRLLDGTQTSITAIDVPRRGVKQIQSWDCAFKDLENI